MAGVGTPQTHDSKGKLAIGNPWRFRPGQSGHVARYNYKSLRKGVIEYAGQQEAAIKRCTWSGLAAYLGMTSRGLTLYAEGKIGNKPDAIIQLLGHYRTIMESQLEDRLTDKDHATTGVTFALTNQFPDRWRKEQHVISNTTVQHVISVALPAGALKSRLNDAGVVLEGEATPVAE